MDPRIYFVYLPVINASRKHLENIVEYYHAYKKIKYRDKYIEEYDFDDFEDDILKNSNLFVLLSDSKYNKIVTKQYENYIPTTTQTIEFLNTTLGKEFFTEFLGEELVNDLTAKDDKMELSFEERYNQ